MQLDSVELENHDRFEMALITIDSVGRAVGCPEGSPFTTIGLAERS